MDFYISNNYIAISGITRDELKQIVVGQHVLKKKHAKYKSNQPYSTLMEFCSNIEECSDYEDYCFYTIDSTIIDNIKAIKDSREILGDSEEELFLKEVIDNFLELEDEIMEKLSFLNTKVPNFIKKDSILYVVNKKRNIDSYKVLQVGADDTDEVYAFCAKLDKDGESSGNNTTLWLHAWDIYSTKKEAEQARRVKIEEAISEHQAEIVKLKELL